LQFPLGLDEFGITGAVFTDVGSLFDVDETGFEVVDDSSLRASAGLGLGWKSPFGPIRIDFSRAFLKETYDETETIRFNFGTRF
jgi:outer membrane protein insertion porin family